METLSHERAQTLVGRFMWSWAIIEACVDDLIATALEIDTAPQFLISAAVPARRKVDMLATLISLSKIGAEDKLKFKEIIKELSSLLDDRNVVAHCMFGPTGDGTAVKFLKVTPGRGKINFPEIRWSEGDFENKFSRSGDLTTNLQRFQQKLKLPKSGLALADALRRTTSNPFQGILHVEKD